MRTGLVFLVLLALAAGAGAQSQQLCIPDSSPAGNLNAFPFSTSGRWGTGWRYQYIITASQLPSKLFIIREAAFVTTLNTTFTATQFQLRFANTTYSAFNATTCFDNVLGSTPTTVYNGPITYPFAANQWSPIGMQNGFLHDGKSNLVIEFRYRTSTTFSIFTPQGPFIRSWTNKWNNHPDPYTATCPENTGGGGPKVCFTIDEIRLRLAGSPSPGGTVDLNLESPADPDKGYQVGSSLGVGPIPVGNRKIGLGLDDLLIMTANNLAPSVFAAFTGLLDGQGDGKAQIHIPNDPRLKGVRIHSAFVTLDASAPLGINRISNTETFSIQ